MLLQSSAGRGFAKVENCCKIYYYLFYDESVEIKI